MNFQTTEWYHPATVPVIPIAPLPQCPHDLYGYYWRSHQNGWVCPKCGRVWAPFIPACPCGDVQPKTTDSSNGP